MTWLDDIEARVEGATEGPWESVADLDGDVVIWRDVELGEPDRLAFVYPDNAAFIAHSRQDIPRLLRVARAAEEIASGDPLVLDDSYSHYVCRYCEAEADFDYDAGGNKVGDGIQHEPDCLWVALVAALAEPDKEATE